MGPNGLAVSRRTVIIGASALLMGCVDGNSGGDGNGTGDGSDDSGEPSADGDNPATGEVEQVGDLTLTLTGQVAADSTPLKVRVVSTARIGSMMRPAATKGSQ